MYSIRKDLKGAVLGLRVEGGIHQRATVELVRTIESRSARWGPIGILAVFDSYPSLNSAEALYEDLRFVLLAKEHISRVAVVGEEPWKDTWVGLFGLFGGIEMAYFQHTSMDHAWRWLTD